MEVINKLMTIGHVLWKEILVSLTFTGRADLMTHFNLNHRILGFPCGLPWYVLDFCNFTFA